MSWRCLFVVALVGACGPVDPKPRKSQLITPRIVATERGPRGGHLVFLGENGARLADLTKSGAVLVRDNGAAWSPDGRSIVFASTRGRGNMTHTSLWIIEARVDAKLHRITVGSSVDRDPAWLPDGTAIVFSSNRAGSFDLWRANLAPDRYGVPRVDGRPIRLTTASSHEFHPSVSPAGDIVYAAADEDSGSAIWILPAGEDEPRRVTAGPADRTPSWSPDGKLIVFAAETEKLIKGDDGIAKHIDADLYLMDADGSNRRVLIEEGLGNQAGPRWSRDGRYIFATSLYRAVATDEAVLASVTFVDLREKPRLLRVLHDPAAVETRMHPTLAPDTLLSTELHRNQPYAEAVRDLGRDLVRRREEEKARKR